jgi:RelA/SpoT family (p)ppGpp synthetase
VRNAENFRKMFLAMADDIRVILLKLCDRLHNMRTLHHLREDKQARIAQETLEIFAPLANRMGLGKWKSELEDLSFKALHPDDYQDIAERIDHEKTQWQQMIDEMGQSMKQALAKQGINVMLQGRVKNYYSVYGKMQQKNKGLQDIYDLTAVRVIVGSEKECYEALGVLHNLYRPIPGRFKDYISIPKANLYQSLHTAVLGTNGRPIEVQIRTAHMHHIAEYGVAAHWRYKAKDAKSASIKDDSTDSKLAWLKQMLEMKEHAPDAQEYVESVKLDLFTDEVFVFSPKGDVINLPLGSTPIDFAFRIHTQVGYTCSGSLVNGKIVPLDFQLSNGDVIEILTNKKATPKLDWIKFAKTHQTKTRIRQWFKRNMREDHVAQGRSMLDAEFTKAHTEEMIKSGKLLAIAEELNYTELEDLLMALGYGELSLARVTNRLHKATPQPSNEQKEPQQQLLDQLAKHPFQKRRGKTKDEIIGLEGMLYHFAKCCSPVPGDDIVGVITRSRGVMVHRFDCVNLNHVMPERLMNTTWSSDDPQDKKRLNTIILEVLVIDRIGIFKDVLTRVSDTNTNLSNARVKTLENNTAIIELAVDVSNIDHLNKLIASISKLSDVLSVRRCQVATGPNKPN